MNSVNVSFLIYNKDVQALNDYYDMANDTYFSGWTGNYYTRCFGLYRKYMYICITLCGTRQIESKLSLHSLAKCLQKTNKYKAYDGKHC